MPAKLPWCFGGAAGRRCRHPRLLPSTARYYSDTPFLGSVAQALAARRPASRVSCSGLCRHYVALAGTSAPFVHAQPIQNRVDQTPSLQMLSLAGPNPDPAYAVRCTRAVFPQQAWSFRKMALLLLPALPQQGRPGPQAPPQRCDRQPPDWFFVSRPWQLTASEARKVKGSLPRRPGLRRIWTVPSGRFCATGDEDEELATPFAMPRPVQHLLAVADPRMQFAMSRVEGFLSAR